MSEPTVLDMISKQLGKIADKQDSQVERLVRIETNHTTMHETMKNVREALGEIRETDQEQSEKIEGISIKAEHIDEIVKQLKKDQAVLSDRITSIEIRLTKEEDSEKGIESKYNFWRDILKSNWFRGASIAVGVLIVALITGKTDWIIDLINRIL